jgi:exopolysaccharide biosynthesis polyprenyl glycosylphosphotransferase
MVERCEKLGVSVSLVPRLFEKMTERLTVDHLGGLPLVTVDRADPKGWQFAIKYAVDRAAAAIFLLLAAPVMLPAALAIFVTMGRPVFFRQLRVGQDGRVFTLVKFRSMRNAPLDTVEVEGDESHRLTHVGSFLRRTSLDELPQLLNVLRGDMSIVGPRPERPELTALFQERIHRYDQRHRVKSGITGWAQINHHYDETVEDVRRKVIYDLDYIARQSLAEDLKIMLLTAPTVMLRKGAW